MRIPPERIPRRFQTVFHRRNTHALNLRNFAHPEFAVVIQNGGFALGVRQFRQCVPDHVGQLQICVFLGGQVFVQFVHISNVHGFGRIVAVHVRGDGEQVGAAFLRGAEFRQIRGIAEEAVERLLRQVFGGGMTSHTIDEIPQDIIVVLFHRLLHCRGCHDASLLSCVMRPH